MWSAGVGESSSSPASSGPLRGVVLTSAKRSFIAGPNFVPSEITPDEAAGTYDLLSAPEFPDLTHLFYRQLRNHSVLAN